MRELRLVHKSLCDQFLPTLETVNSESGVGEHPVYKIGPLTHLNTLELRYIRHPEDSLDGAIFALVRQTLPSGASRSVCR